MEQTKLTPSGRPFDIHDRLLLFACDIVRVTQFLHTRGPIARQLSYQILNAGTSVGSNAEEADGASSHNDFIAKNRIALKEAKETRRSSTRSSRNPTNWSGFSARLCTTRCATRRPKAARN